MAETQAISTKERNILAGMDEIGLYGVQGFSLRRVAAVCGISCAAPYKHFSDKQELFRAMVRYVNEKWRCWLEGEDNRETPAAERIVAAAMCCIGLITESLQC